MNCSSGTRRASLRLLWVLALGAAPLAYGQHSHDSGGHKDPAPAQAASPDTRNVVIFPPQLKQHTLENMRDHLLALMEIQNHLAQFEFDRAAEVAEKRLGMSSLRLHGAHEVAKYMPRGMQDAGTAMHRSASRFAIATQEAWITRDLARPLQALGAVTQACVACHAGYRLK